MLHYNPQHVSSSTMLIFRMKNCIMTASGIVTPDAVIIQLVLLKMSIVLLETC